MARSKWQQENKPRLAAYKRARRAAGFEKPRDPQYHKKYHLKRQYGMTPEEHAALLIAQEGRCAICQESLDRTNVDHDHATGAVRGILCPSCNMALGLFRDDAAIIAAALTYLKGF